MKIVKKICTHCGEAKPPSKFARHSATLDRLQSWCRECAVEYAINKRAAARAKWAAIARKAAGAR